MKAAALLSLAVLSGCASGYGISLDIEPGCAMGDEGLRLVVEFDNAPTKSALLDRAFFQGGHRVVILPPAGASLVRIRVDDANGMTVAGPLEITIEGHRLDDLRLDLPASGPWCPRADGGYRDLAINDLAPDLPDAAIDAPLDGNADLSVRDFRSLERPEDLGQGDHSLVDAPVDFLPDDRSLVDLIVLDETADLSSPDLRLPPDLACGPGWNDCNGAVPGCETDTRSDPDNCGGCGIVCSNKNINRRCTNGVCDGDCLGDWLDCDGSKLTNGCEINGGNNVDNCGGCGISCKGMTPWACTNSQCSNVCASGWTDCDGDLRTGCEINTDSDPKNCGGCGSAFACSANHVFPITCSGGTCNGTCWGSWSDCDNNKLINGCEKLGLTCP